MDKFFNTLFFDDPSIDTDHILRIVESCRPKDPYDFIRVLSVQDDGLYFLTASRSTAEAIARRVSMECPNTEIELNLDHSSYDPSYTHSIYYNGRVTLEVFCCPCAFSIRVPSCLGYDGDMFTSDCCVPEEYFTARDDVTAMADVVLKTAMENAPNKEGAEMLSNDSEMFGAALKVAEESLTRLYDPDNFCPLACSNDCPSTTSSPDTPPEEPYYANDDSEFPF